jgi:hypothetical protein
MPGKSRTSGDPDFADWKLREGDNSGPMPGTMNHKGLYRRGQLVRFGPSCDRPGAHGSFAECRIQVA